MCSQTEAFDFFIKLSRLLLGMKKVEKSFEKY